MTTGSFRTPPSRHRQSPCHSHRQTFYPAIGTILLPVDLVTFNLSLIGNHPHQQPALYCHPILPSWTRVQERCQQESTTTEGETMSRDERRRRRDREPPLGSGTPRPSAMRHLAWGGTHHRRGVGGRGGRRRWTEEPGDGGSPDVTGRSAIRERRGFFLLIWTQPKREPWEPDLNLVGWVWVPYLSSWMG